MKKIIFDTNMLISIVRFKLDLEEEIKKIIFEPFEIFTLNSVVKELKTIASKKTTESKYAKLALSLLKSRNIKILKSKGKKADDAILSLADRNTIVATNDKELRKRLKAFRTKTIYLRATKYLAMG